MRLTKTLLHEAAVTHILSGLCYDCMTIGIYSWYHEVTCNSHKTGSTLDLPHMLPAKVEIRNSAHGYMIHMVHGTGIYKLHNPRTSSQMPSSHAVLRRNLPVHIAKHLNLYSIAMLISNTYTWHSPSVHHGLSAITRGLLYSLSSNVHSCCLSQWSL